VIDHERLASTLGSPHLERFRNLLRRRIETGQSLDTRMSFKNPSEQERRALEPLLGRQAGRGQSITLNPREIADRLAAADIAPNLRSALEALGPALRDLRGLRAAEKRAWDEVDDRIAAAAVALPELVPVWTEARQQGLIRRYSAGDPVSAMRLADELCSVAAALGMEKAPRQGEAERGLGEGLEAPRVRHLLLQELATRATGNAHALDPGQALGTLATRYAARVGGQSGGTSPEERRTAWSSAGVEIDSVSPQVLVIGLRASGSGAVDALLETSAEVAEPLRLTLRQLERHPPCLQRTGPVYITENPSVLLAAADRLTHACPPLVCTEGQPDGAVGRLLEAIEATGAQLWYHGDFDWPGLRIAGSIMARYRAKPWRLGTRDYLEAPSGPELFGPAAVTPWDEELAIEMEARGCAVHEESVMGLLLGDLAGSSPS
jgi:uncharacterized protein (TIGR02679 family)